MQGVANLLTGMFGGLGGSALIGETVINVLHGARGRMSCIVTGLTMLVIMESLGPVVKVREGGLETILGVPSHASTCYHTSHTTTVTISRCSTTKKTNKQLMPIAALSGVIFAVSLHTFQWGSFIKLYYGPKHDSFVMVVRALLSAFLCFCCVSVLPPSVFPQP